MDNKHVQKFMVQVNELITLQKEKDSLFEALKRYQSLSDVKRLVQDLKNVLNQPDKLEIYDFVRPLIRPQHQQNYDKMAPSTPGQRLRIISLRRRMNESFGFAVRGGFEHGVGIFVSHIDPGSQADQRGLKMGDEILRVNGFTIAEAIHEEVLNLIKGQDEIELKVTSIGMVPIKQTPTDPVTWQYVDKPGVANQQTTNSSQGGDKDNLVKLFINLRGAPSLGCTIISGPKTFPGIYIETVRPGSLGDDYKLEAGDQIIEVNGKSFLEIKHKEAIVELKGNKELNMVIKKGAGVPLMGVKKDREEISVATIERAPSPALMPEDESEILEEDIHAKEERQKWEEDQMKIHKKREEERVKEEFRRREMEKQMLEERRQQEELEKQLEIEKLKEEEERRRNEEEKQRRKEEEKRRKEEEEAKKRERKKKEEEEEKRQKAELLLKKQQSAVLAGRSGSHNSMKPTLLGAASQSKSSFGKASDKVVKEVSIKKEEDLPLDVEVEGGVGSPLGGKIVVADIYYNGAVDRNGEIKKGDQLLKINGQSLEDVSLTEAQEILWKVESECRIGGNIHITVAEAEFRPDEISIGVPTSNLDYLEQYHTDFDDDTSLAYWSENEDNFGVSPVTYIY